MNSLCNTKFKLYYLIPLYTVLLWSSVTLHSQCFPTGINLNTQSAIDNFSTNFPGCTHILGNVTITGVDITNLSGLSSISMIDGYLFIIDCPALTTTAGINSLLSVSGEVKIRNIPSMTNLTGFSALHTCGNLNINANQNLAHISGFQALQTVNGFVKIHFNDNLHNLSGLQALHDVKQIFINNNNILTNLTPLEQIQSNTLNFLEIKNNPQLAICHISNFCTFLANGGNYTIINNQIGCEDREIILQNCYPGTCGYSGINFYFQAHIDNFTTNYPGCHTIKGNVEIRDVSSLSPFKCFTKH
ncbi:MAG: hypothetical protein IPO92_19285 [Saprospiraceae bacterium]|nr:hypothetical protein [Saprospiraceae bacterium]